MSTTQLYEATGNELADRILRMIPDHPEILEMESACDLFKIDGFDCSDLNPSLAQAGWAFNRARQVFLNNKEKGKT